MRGGAFGMGSIHVEGQALAEDRHHQAEADDHLRRGDDHHHEREDLAIGVVPVAAEADEGDVGSQQDGERVVEDGVRDEADRACHGKSRPSP